MADLRAKLSFDEVVVWATAWDCLPDSMAALALAARIPVKRAYAICRKIAASGWMQVSRHGRRLCPTALIPHACQEKLARVLQEEYEAAPSKGEFLMKRCLDALVHSEDFIDNARLEAIQNITGAPMELDRYYREKVAFEFNGPQHLGVTETFADEQAALELQSRDTRKVWLCEKAGISLIRIYVPDLHPRILARSIPSCLQRNPVDRDGPYYKTLSSLCVSYVAKATGVDIQEIMTGTPHDAGGRQHQVRSNWRQKSVPSKPEGDS
jgi:hypothetical protein